MEMLELTSEECDSLKDVINKKEVNNLLVSKFEDWLDRSIEYLEEDENNKIDNTI